MSLCVKLYHPIRGQALIVPVGDGPVPAFLYVGAAELNGHVHVWDVTGDHDLDKHLLYCYRGMIPEIQLEAEAARRGLRLSEIQRVGF